MKEFLNFNSKNISWFRCGGNVNVFYIIDNLKELQSVIQKYPQYSDKILVIGAGSNILIRDGGFDGLVLKLTSEFNKINLKSYENDNNKIILTTGSCCLDKQVSDFALNNNLIGCEFLATIPGTIGGAITMNAGCYGQEIKDILFSVKLLYKNEIITLSKDDLCFQYREAKIPNNSIILEADFLLKKGNKEEIDESKNKIKEMLSLRKLNQITGLTCGSTFKNPIDSNGSRISAWKLIDEVRLRGFQIGGAKFSDKHCNFILNTGNATATNIENLILLAKQLVKEKFNINLVEEIKIIGNKI